MGHRPMDRSQRRLQVGATDLIMGDAMQTALIVFFPGVTQLDATAPAQAFASSRRIKVISASIDGEAVSAKGCGLEIQPSHRLQDITSVDILCIPGGAGCLDAIENPELLTLVRKIGLGARYVSSVCTGSLVLGAAGLLDGYRATSHWMWRDYLAQFGATPVDDRVVTDRNRITGGGVTAGLYMALVMLAQLFGDEVARETQLLLEYDPAPPFDTGSPRRAGPEMVDRIRSGATERSRRISLAASSARRLWQ